MPYAPVVVELTGKSTKVSPVWEHPTAVLAAAEVGGAEMEGVTLDSRRLVFRPGLVRTGNYAFRVGTAGSATLVLQTVLPAMLVARGEWNLTLEGGTHNPQAPPLDFLEKAYLPLVNRLGPHVEALNDQAAAEAASGVAMSVRRLPIAATTLSRSKPCRNVWEVPAHRRGNWWNGAIGKADDDCNAPAKRD